MAVGASIPVTTAPNIAGTVPGGISSTPAVAAGRGTMPMTMPSMPGMPFPNQAMMGMPNMSAMPFPAMAGMPNFAGNPMMGRGIPAMGRGMPMMNGMGMQGMPGVQPKAMGTQPPTAPR